MSEWTDEMMIEDALNALKTMYGEKVGRVVNHARSNWVKDPYIVTAWSHMKVGSKFSDCDDIQKPIWNKVFFAGEHTYGEFLGTTNGAFISGIRAGEAIAKLSLKEI